MVFLELRPFGNAPVLDCAGIELRIEPAGDAAQGLCIVAAARQPLTRLNGIFLELRGRQFRRTVEMLVENDPQGRRKPVAGKQFLIQSIATPLPALLLIRIAALLVNFYQKLDRREIFLVRGALDQVQPLVGIERGLVAAHHLHTAVVHLVGHLDAHAELSVLLDLRRVLAAELVARIDLDQPVDSLLVAAPRRNVEHPDDLPDGHLLRTELVLDIEARQVFGARSGPFVTAEITAPRLFVLLVLLVKESQQVGGELLLAQIPAFGPAIGVLLLSLVPADSRHARESVRNVVKGRLLVIFHGRFHIAVEVVE